jgi:hypothetical protein
MNPDGGEFGPRNVLPQIVELVVEILIQRGNANVTSGPHRSTSLKAATVKVAKVPKQSQITDQPQIVAVPFSVPAQEVLAVPQTQVGGFSHRRLRRSVSFAAVHPSSPESPHVVETFWRRC